MSLPLASPPPRPTLATYTQLFRTLQQRACSTHGAYHPTHPPTHREADVVHARGHGAQGLLGDHIYPTTIKDDELPRQVLGICPSFQGSGGVGLSHPPQWALSRVTG
jgi:hypothetical protein